MKSLYETDPYAWAMQNAELVRERRFEEADMDNIAEELEELGNNRRHELASRLKVLLAHLLKWSLQPQRNSRSWRATINVQRRDIAFLLDRTPSLVPRVAEEVEAVYPYAAANATDEMLLDDNPFPGTCPFTPQQILDVGYLPEPTAPATQSSSDRR